MPSQLEYFRIRQAGELPDVFSNTVYGLKNSMEIIVGKTHFAAESQDISVCATRGEICAKLLRTALSFGERCRLQLFPSAPARPPRSLTDRANDKATLSPGRMGSNRSGSRTKRSGFMDF